MFCLNHLAQLGRLYDELRAKETDVIAIGGSGANAASRIARLFRTPFPVVGDPNRTAYRAYGFAKTALVIQQSGTVLVDRNGIIRYVHRVANPQHSFPRDELLRAVDELAAT